MFGFLPGMSARDAADREIGNNQFNDTRSGITDDGWNWQDQFGALLGGYTKEDVEKLGQTKLDAALKKELDARYETTGTDLSGFGQTGKYSGNVTGLTKQVLNNQLSSDSARLTALVNNQSISGYDPSSLPENASTTQILQSGRTQRDLNEEEAESKAAGIRQEGYDRQDSLLAHQTSQTNAMNAHNADQANKQRAHEFAVQEARNNQTMQLAMMDREGKMADRRYAREDRAADRRQQSIMMLVKGLAQLGQGFSL